MKVLSSWRTSAIGVITALLLLLTQASALLDGDPKTVFVPERVIEALGILGIGLTARDHSVSSKAAGVK
jgi:hypothetical protein